MPDETEATPPTPERSGRSFGLVALIALIVVCGALAFVIFGMGSSSLLPANYNGFDH
jgi:hypothetical protein